MLDTTNFYRIASRLSVPVLLIQLGLAALLSGFFYDVSSTTALAAPLASPSLADLRLEWVAGSGAITAGGAIEGQAGDAVSVPYRLRNVGGNNAFAAVVESWTALGREGRPIRLQPGPVAGEIQKRHLELSLASGMRELCLEVKLQTLEAGSPGDPNLDDNRICCRVIVERPPDSHSLPQSEGRTP